jgi:hypothetical protein
MMRTAFIAAFAVAQLASSQFNLGLAPVTDPEAYAVYASLLPSEWTVRTGKATRLVIERETATYNKCLPSGGAMEREWAPILESYRKENATVGQVLADQPLGIAYDVVARDEINAIFVGAARPTIEPMRPGMKLPPARPGSPDGWQSFYDRFPDSAGYMQFSAVGFDAGKTRALVYIAHHCGNLCGGGAHHLLQKVDGAWIEVRLKDVTQCIWMS